jgi:hypothetical protein
MWKIIVANKSDDDFLNNLSDTAYEEIVNNFVEVIKVFDNLHSSVYCSSGILPVGSYNATDEKLSVHYHVDNDEEMIRITSVELE